MLGGLGLSLALLLAAACAQQSPEERIAALRAAYTVEPTSFTVLDEPQTEVSPEAEGDLEGVAAEEGAEEGAAGAGEEIPVQTDIVLDLLVTTTERETLPGITAEFEHRRGGELVEHRRLWIDTSKVMLGSGAQISETVPDVDYRPGDEFTVYVRTSIPEEERGEYREFQAASEGS